MSVVIFFDQQKNIVDVDFHLLDELDFKYDVIRNIFFFVLLAPVPPLVVKIIVSSLLVLHIAFGQNVIPRKFVESGKNVPHS